MAIDQGTTGSRAVVYDKYGIKVAGAYQEFRQYFPKPGWVEHDPDEIWTSVNNTVQAVLEKVPADSISAIGITNQRETTVMWDKRTGQPYMNAIVWQCTRTDEICRNLAEEGGQDRFRAKTGLPISTYFAGPKIRWILDHVEAARKDAEKGVALFGTIESWIIWWLTGGPDNGSHVTDVSNASRTLLMDLQSLTWDEEILSVLNIPYHQNGKYHQSQ